MAPIPVIVMEWRPDARRTRAGFVDLHFLDIALNIRDAEVHKFTTRGGERIRWLSYPGRSYIAAGDIRRVHAVIFFSRSRHADICDQVFDQLKTMAPDEFAEPEARVA